MLTALGVVFVAELGDKTQLVALGFGARHRLLPVVTGVVAAYAATGLLSVVVGGTLGAAFPTRAVGVASGLLFLGFAGWTLWGPEDAHGHGSEEDDGGDEASDGRDGGRCGGLVGQRSVVLSVAATMFVAELGDKTMLATGTLAARGNPALVWIGATLGIILSGLLGVLLGRVFGARLPARATRVGSAVLFALFGAIVLVTSLW
jgi:putative Ca2+/H+ antiporter (TMEM165/GDT1 family)